MDEDVTLTTRNRIVYSRTVKVYNNIDNVVTIAFRNSDQKPANIVGKAFTFTVSDGNSSVWTTNVMVSNVTTAVGTITIDQANIANLTSEFYNYSISYNSGNLILPAYADDNWGAAGQLQVISNLY